MNKTIKSILCIALCFATVSAFVGCSKKEEPLAELTEENVKTSVTTVEKALQEFDTDTLNEYVDSSTLSTIVSYAEKHQQFKDLGQAMFKSLTLDIVSIDLDNKTVTVSSNNKRMYIVASNFAYDLKQNYSTISLLSKLEDETFLNNNLATLTEEIAQCDMQEEPTEITLTLTQASGRLILGFDEEAEDAVSGGAIGAIKSVYTD